MLGEILVLPVSTGPFVVPDVKDRSSLRGKLGFDRFRIDLWPCRPSFSSDYLLGLLLGGIGVGGGDGGF